MTQSESVTTKVWNDSAALSRSALFISLTYVQIAEFMSLEARVGNSFAEKSKLEKRFHRTGSFIVGFMTSETIPSGLNLRAKLEGIGVLSEWLDFMANIITIAPFITADPYVLYKNQNDLYHTEVTRRIAQSLEIIIPSQDHIVEITRQYFLEKRGATPEGIRGQQLLQQTYPEDYQVIISSEGYKWFTSE
jgi:hypothetical protein